jgi:tRNA-splicing ligase RtcB
MTTAARQKVGGGTLLPREAGAHADVRVWATHLDRATADQLRRLARQAYVVSHVAAMADAHLSEGVAVGTVFATESVVVPAALGGDLGCGMAAVRLNLAAASLDRTILERCIVALDAAIPSGARVHPRALAELPEALVSCALSTRTLTRERGANAARQLGTLGGGNHFLELDRDLQGNVWLLVHSGSRGIGAAIAQHHIRAARALGIGQLGGLDIARVEGAAYLEDHAWAVAFAKANRSTLIRHALEVLGSVLGRPVDGEAVVDVPHNFIARETWRGRELLVHRKGAVAAPRGGLALIPGSMGSASYVVEGLGCELAFASCSHGAGRIMSRREARERLSSRALAYAMRNVVHPPRDPRALLEESPDAYRDIVEVLDAQVELVVRRTRLEPLAVLKG